MKNRRLDISTMATGDKCLIRIIDGINTIRMIWGVNYGIAITNIMQEWGCTKLTYSPLARIKFLGKTPRKSLQFPKTMV